MQADLTIKKRLLIMLAVLTLLFSLVGVRIGSLTLFQGEALTARGVRQWTREGIVTARRGAIEDTRGETLALSATAYVVTVNPQTVTDAAAFARAVAPPLGMDAAAIEKRLENKRLASVILKRQVPRETVDELRVLRGGVAPCDGAGCDGHDRGGSGQTALRQGTGNGSGRQRPGGAPGARSRRLRPFGQHGAGIF